MINKLFKSMDEAVADIPDGASVMVGGFAPGTPYNLVSALHRQGAKDLTLICIAAMGLRRPDAGLLVRENRVKKLISQGGDDPKGGIPQGTLVERLRAGAAGIPAFFTPTGVGTLLAEGKEHREFNGRTYLLEHAITADYALIRAWRADTAGNLQFQFTQRTDNPLMARAARCTIVEVEEPVVEAGELDPSFIHVPGVYVKRIVKIPPEPEGFLDRPYNVQGVATTGRATTRGI
jgi:3-oxoacid CoA-transferase A subunit